MSGPEGVGEPTSTLVVRRAGEEQLAWVELEGELLVWSDVSRELHRLDPVAVAIFDACDGQRTVGELITDLAASFGLPPAQIHDDVATCVEGFVGIGLVTVVSA